MWKRQNSSPPPWKHKVKDFAKRAAPPWKFKDFAQRDNAAAPPWAEPILL